MRIGRPFAAWVLAALLLLGAGVGGQASASHSSPTRDDYHAVRPPIVAFYRQRDEMVYTIAVRLNRALPPTRVKPKVRLFALAGARRGPYYGDPETVANRIGRPSRNCLYITAILTTRAWPAALRHPHTGQTVFFKARAGRDRYHLPPQRARLTQVPSSSVYRAARFVRPLGCS